MNSPFGKLATAAAIVLVAATTILVLDRSASRAYAIGDISAAFDQAQVIHVKGRRYFPRFKMNNGTERPPVVIESWFDLENGRMRQTQVGISQSASSSSHGVPDVNTAVTVTETVCDGPYLMTLDHATRTAGFARISEYGRQLMTYRQSQMLWSRLCSQPAQLEHFTRTGQDEIDGVPHDIWQLDSAGGMGGFVTGGGVNAGVGGSGGGGGGGSVPGRVNPRIPLPALRSKLWVSADSGRLARAQVLSQGQDGRWELEQDYDAIDYDVAIPEDTFVTEPPVGYTATNSKETAPVMNLWGPTARCGNLECSAPASFTLADGGVIVAWQSSDLNSEESQEPLFADLALGGPVPSLPIELFAIKPAGASDRTAYTARHLAHTSKAGRLTEWTLYVPRSDPPAAVKYQGYDAICRFNVATVPNGVVGMNLGYGVPVESAEDFEKWVLGAMAELSDDAVPADVTYEAVSNLAREVRATGRP